MSSNNNHGTGHLVTLDCLRGFAALAVCLFHYTGLVLPKLKVDAVQDLFSWGYAGVETFFVISGFILPYSIMGRPTSATSMGVFMLKRIARICPPSYVVILLTVLQYYIVSNVLHSNSDWWAGISTARLIANLSFTVPFTPYTWLNGIFWTISIEFQYYIILSLVYSLAFKSARRLYAFSISGLLISIVPIWGLGSFPLYASYFAMGGFVLIRKQQRVSNGQFIASILLCAPFAIWTGSLVGACFGVATAFTIDRILWRSPAWRFLGKISFSLYLTHILIGSTMERLLVILIRPEAIITKILLQLVILGTAIAGAWVFYCLFERPSMALAKRISGRHLEYLRRKWDARGI